MPSSSPIKSTNLMVRRGARLAHGLRERFMTAPHPAALSTAPGPRSFESGARLRL